jgi:hypothetical protein
MTSREIEDTSGFLSGTDSQAEEKEKVSGKRGRHSPKISARGDLGKRLSNV